MFQPEVTITTSRMRGMKVVRTIQPCERRSGVAKACSVTDATRRCRKEPRLSSSWDHLMSAAHAQSKPRMFVAWDQHPLQHEASRHLNRTGSRNADSAALQESPAVAAAPSWLVVGMRAFLRMEVGARVCEVPCMAEQLPGWRRGCARL